MSSQQRRALYTLTDPGPLIALVADTLPEHAQIVAALNSLPKRPLITTWPCLTEAMYLLHKEGGHAAQDQLWSYVLDGLVILYDVTSAEQQRMRELMRRYADTPMDLADASLVVAAESLGLRQIFTLDSDFYLYRLADGAVLEVIP